MAGFGYNKEDQVLQHLSEVFANSPNINGDVIRRVAEKCQFDDYLSVQHLIELSTQPSPTKMPSNKSKKAIEIENVIDKINKGHKVLVIVRGLPGSGKSSLSRQILEKTIGPNYAASHILSTDDFFFKDGLYTFIPNLIGEAHGWNHNRAFKAMSKGYSPVIIDNTNTEMWEMKPYAMMATDFGYYIDILEPDTPWCFFEKELFKRNTHNVSKASIRNMLDRYQKNITSVKLLAAYDCKYQLQKPPQFRLHPPVNVKMSSNFMEFHEPPKMQSTSVDDILMQTDVSQLTTPVLKPMHSKIKQSCSLFDGINTWGIDQSALRFWDIVTPIKDDAAPHQPHQQQEVIPIVDTQDVATSTDGNWDDGQILVTCNRDINRNLPMKPMGVPKKIMVDKSCLTEDFVDHQLEDLCRVFPNIPPNVVKLWFAKCNYNFDCTMELLLSEKDEDLKIIIDEVDENEVIELTSDSSSGNSSSEDEQPRTPKRLVSTEEVEELKKCLEGKVNINNHHYSEKLMKIRQKRYGLTKSESSTSEMDIDDDSEVKSEDSNDAVDTVEINLGENFVKQLEQHFGDPALIYPEGFLPIVQMPVDLARQLYMFYIESVYQQMEMQKVIMDDLVKEDEEFARKLQSEESKCRQAEPEDLAAIMKEQKELGRWQREIDKWKDDTPDTIAARLTKEKLFKSFPKVDRDTLVELLHAHDNVYKDTVDSLLVNIGVDNVDGDVEAIKNPPLQSGVLDEMWEAHNNCRKDEHEETEPLSATNYRVAAGKYLEVRTKLYEKAKNYHQNGMREVAQFYSGLASKQTQFYEHANSLAATAFIDEHSKRLEDFNTLDLHFLYIKEALPCLDIFLDRNINLLRLGSAKNAEKLQIITGRGKNSKNGIARIRPAVIARLKQRNIKYTQLNPGLLEINVNRTSPISSEL